MLVGVKRLFPIAATGPVVFNSVSGYDWKNVEPTAKFANVLGAPFASQDTSTYRQYRFRVTYYDSLTSVGNANLQLSISHDGSFAPGVLSVDNLDLPPAHCPKGSTSTTSYTPWFTVGNGSVDKIQPYLNTNAHLSVRFNNAQSVPGLSAILYEVDLECWDSTSPTAVDTTTIPGTTTLVRCYHMHEITFVSNT
jgi:hypothetical protein